LFIGIKYKSSTFAKYYLVSIFFVVLSNFLPIDICVRSDTSIHVSVIPVILENGKKIIQIKTKIIYRNLMLIMSYIDLIVAEMLQNIQLYFSFRYESISRILSIESTGSINI
jgi:hypothetical protein